MNLFVAMMLPLAVLLLAIGMLTSKPDWFPPATRIAAALLAFAVIFMILLNGAR